MGSALRHDSELVTNGTEAKKVFLAGLSDAGFEVAKKIIDESEANFYQWVYVAESYYELLHVELLNRRYCNVENLWREASRRCC
jgi:hypothetical protein